MKRRTFLEVGWGAVWATPLLAAAQQDEAVKQDALDAAAEILAAAVDAHQVEAASLYVRRGETEFAKAFGAAESVDDLFLIASISKPMSVAALMTLYDQGEVQLDDPVRKFLPQFTGEGRDQVTMEHLLTHVSGLPDQLPENDRLRARHAELAEFVEGALRTPLRFPPASRYSYSSMAILLASEVARRISGKEFPELVETAVFQPLEMKRSALGLGRFPLEETMRCQVESAAPESGAGDPAARTWDWNSRYWRQLGAPWGGVHASAADVARFLSEFLHPQGKLFSASTARRMVRNHNPAGLKPRGLGFDLGTQVGGRGCSETTFGHGGATGTLAWADPATGTVCVVLTTLPSGAVTPHPRQQVSERVAA